MKIRLWSDPRWLDRVHWWDRALPIIEPATTIPRTVRQIFLGREIQPFVRAHLATFAEDNPDWAFELYDDPAIDTFLQHHYSPAVAGVLRRIDPEYAAARADLFRYLLIYAVGGVYLDVKSRFDRPISSVLTGNEHFVLSQWRNLPGEFHHTIGLFPDIDHVPGGEFQQWHVIAAAGHPFLRAVLTHVLANVEFYSPWRLSVGGPGVLRTTGPIAYTRAIAPLLDRDIPYTRIANETEIGLEFSYYNPQGMFGRRHYSQLTTPIVSRGRSDLLSAKAFGAVKRLKKVLGR